MHGERNDKWRMELPDNPERNRMIQKKPEGTGRAGWNRKSRMASGIIDIEKSKIISGETGERSMEKDRHAVKRDGQ